MTKDITYYRAQRYEKCADPVVEPTGERYWVAYITELPGCKTDGATRVEALANLEDAFDDYITACLDEGRSIPEAHKPPAGPPMKIEVLLRVNRPVTKTRTASRTERFELEAPSDPATATPQFDSPRLRTGLALAADRS